MKIITKTFDSLPIASRVSAVIFVVNSLVILFYFAVSCYESRVTLEKNTIDNATRAVNSRAKILAQPLWDLDLTGLNDIVDDLVDDETALQATVFDEHGKVIFNIGDASGNQYQTIPVASEIIHIDGERSRPIGRLSTVISLRQVREVFIEQVITSACAYFILLAALTFAISFVVRRFSAPLVAITAAMDAYAAGNKSVEIAPSRADDEVGHLTRSFYKMRREIEAFNETLEQTVRARTEELVIAKERSEAAGAAKTQFLANVSHELRTPLNGILGMTSLTLDSELTPEQRENLTAVYTSGENLLTLINDILDFNKITSGKFQISAVPFNLAALIKDVVTSLSVQAEKKGIFVTHVIEHNVPSNIVGDDVRVRQLLVNLIGNAIKFTNVGGIIVHVLKQSQLDRRVVLSFVFTDTGMGIPREKQDIIFDPFSQADASTTRKFGGTGLGLAIVSQLVQLMEGTLLLSSKEGVGTAFRIDLPFLMLAEISSAEPEKIQAPIQNVQLSQHGEILLVEDNLTNQKLAIKILQRAGHSVTLAENGARALEQLQNKEFDVVLMDIQMPVMGGEEATRIIRQKETGERRIPIIAMTANAMAGDREKYLACGMDDYISKPVRRNDLLNLIEQHLSRRGR